MSGQHQEGATGMKIIGDRLLQARQRRGMTQKRLAKEIATSASHLSSMEHGRVGISIRTALGVARILRVSVEYLAGMVDDPRSPSDMVAEIERQSDEIGEIKKKHEDDDYVAISEIDTSAGAGAVADDEKITGHMKFPHQWLRNRCLRPAVCRIIRVSGDSMEPTLPNRAAILVNLGSNHVQDGKVFVIRIGDDLVVKRTVRDPEAGWLLVSDSSAKEIWATRPWPEDAQIIGEVKWVGRALP